MRRFHHWLWRSSHAFTRSRRNTSGSTGAPTSLMGGERGGQLLPFAHEPRHLLLGALALGGHRAHALAVGVERRIPEPFADLGQPSLERVDLALHVLETPAQLPHVLRDLPGALGRFRARRTSIFASATRAFSPPESTAIFFSTASPEKRNVPRIVRSRVCPSSGAARSSSSRTVNDGVSASS